MLSAFRPEAIHELKARDKSKIESLLAYGDRLLVGLSTGSLRIYRINETSSLPADSEHASQNGDAQPQSPTKLKPVELLREEEKFGRKAVQHLAIIKEANLLITLSDNYIAFHDLQTYSLVERIEKTKGATCFTVTSNVVRDAETDVPSLVSRLAVGVKRKVLCWVWRDMEMESQEASEIGVEASVKNLNWVHGEGGSVRLVVGMDPGFAVVDVDAVGREDGEGEGGAEEAVKLVYKPASRQDATSGELAGVRFGAVSSSGMGYMGMASWVPKPMASGLSDGQVLLAKDVNTLFVDIDGRPLEKRQVPWHLAPEAVGYSYPYLLALQPPERGSLQIRNPDTLSLLQTIPVPSANILHVPQPNISLAHAGKGFLVASDRTIWRMNALPYDTQLAELVEKQRFDEAVSLLTLLEDTLIDDKMGRIRDIKILKAISLFQQQKYLPALDLFTEAEAPPDRVISLYPRSIAGELSTVPEPSTEESERENALDEETKPDETTAAKEPPTTPAKGMLSKFKSGHARTGSDPASLKATPRADSDNMSIRTPKATPAKPAPAADKPLEGEDLKLAVRYLCSFLPQPRRVIQKYLATDGTLKQSPPVLDPETGRPGFGNILPERVFASPTAGTEGEGGREVDWQAELLKTAKLVDTTLFRAYMLWAPSLAGPLFRLDNFCDPEVVQRSLYESERYGDLIDFLHGKRLHRQALEMLVKFGKGDVPRRDGGGGGEGERSGESAREVGVGTDVGVASDAVPQDLKGPERTVQYLKQLPPELVDLVLEFVRWPLDVERQKGMEVFLADTDYAERLPRDKVMEFLSEVDEELEEQYLEHIITELGESTAEFHQRLVDIYIHRLKDPDGSGDPETKQDLKTKFEDFLRKSKSYNKGATFRQLPPENPTFFESRAIVLSAMGNHKQALSIYVFQLADYAKAETYCNEVYARKQQEHLEACLLDTNHMHEKSGSAFSFQSAGAGVGGAEGGENVFAMLLGLYLKPPGGEQKRWPQALDLLSRHGARLPASSTLDLMPDDLAVAELQDYFLGRIRNATSTLRQTSIVKSLSAVQKVETERKWLVGDEGEARGQGRGKAGGRGRNGRVRIGEEDHCRVCHKRFGASAVRIWPDGAVVHYGCRPVLAEGGGVGLSAGGERRASGARAWG